MLIAPTSRTRLKLFRLLALCILALVLVWLIATTTLTAYLARAAPEAALRLHPTASSALVLLATNALDRVLAAEQARSAGDKSAAIAVPPSAPGAEPSSKQIRLWASTAVAHDPLNARAMRILGQLAAKASKHSESIRFTRAAARRSLRETIAVYIMMRESLAQEDHAKTLHYADAILRTKPSVARFVVPTLVQLAESDVGKDALLALLGRNPPWRSQFFSALSRSVTDARAPLFFLLKLRETQHPATPAEIHNYLAFLLAGQFYEVAYYTWLQFLPPEQLRGADLLFNGSFEIKLSGAPFDWQIRRASGVIVDIAPRPDEHGHRALYIEFGQGRVQFGGVRQITLLAPGTYRLHGKYRGRIIGRRGLVWQIACLGDHPKRIGASSMVIGIARMWKNFETVFKVPDNCRAQAIRLVFDARSASERFVTGRIWYDELGISRQ